MDMKERLSVTLAETRRIQEQHEDALEAQKFEFEKSVRNKSEQHLQEIDNLKKEVAEATLAAAGKFLTEEDVQACWPPTYSMILCCYFELFWLEFDIDPLRLVSQMLWHSFRRTGRLPKND